MHRCTQTWSGIHSQTFLRDSAQATSRRSLVFEPSDAASVAVADEAGAGHMDQKQQA